MSEVLIPMGSHKAFAATDLAEGRLFKWANVPENVTYTAEGNRPIGIVINDIVAGEILSATGSAEWFIKSGIVKVPLDTEIAVGTEVMAGTNGVIAAHTGTNYAFGVVLTARDDNNESEIYIY